MALDANIIQGIIADFIASKSKVVEEIKKGLTKSRGGILPHDTTGATADSIEVKPPQWDGANLTWEFESDAGSYLNKGVVAGRKVNLGKILTWVKNKYGLQGSDAKRMAYFVVKKMDERGNPKKKGWFDEIEPNVNSMVNTIITESMTKSIAIASEKQLNKKIR